MKAPRAPVLACLLACAANPAQASPGRAPRRAAVRRLPPLETLKAGLQRALSKTYPEIERTYWGSGGPGGGPPAVEMLATPEQLTRSSSRPVTFAALGDSGIELALFKGDAYLTRYFHSRRVAPHVQRPLPPLEDVSRGQPWFKWNRRKRTFELKRRGLQSHLIKKLLPPGGDLKIYKGTSKERLSGLDVFKRLPADCAAETLYMRAWKFLRPAESFGAYFFAHDKEGARQWAEDALISVRFPRAEILRLARRGEVYVGVENDYVELGFFEPRSIKAIADRYQLE
jgi:hypothetical protein